MAGFGKVAGEMFLRSGRSVGQPDVVTVVVLMGPSHWSEEYESVTFQRINGWSEKLEVIGVRQR